MTRGPGIARLIMLTTIATTGGRPLPAADWSGSLEASANAAYVTNPQMLAGSNASDQTAVLTVDGNTTAQTERGQLTVTPRFSVTRYKEETQLDITAGSIDFAALEKTERGQWTVSGQALTDSTVTSELGLTGITNVNLRHTAGTLSIGYEYQTTERLSWQLQGSGQLTHYTDAARFGLTNYNYASAKLGPSWAFSERLQGSAFVEADRLNPQGGTRQNSYTAGLELMRNVSEKYSWRASLGSTRTQASGAGSATSAFAELGGSRKGERVQWDFSAKQAILPIGIGLLTKQQTATLVVTVNTSEHGTLSLSANGVRSYPVILPHEVVYTGAEWGQASAEWRYAFSPHWVLSLLYLQARARSGDVNEWANGNQARLGIVWQSGRL